MVERRILFLVSAYSSSNSGVGGVYFSLRELTLQFIRAWPDTRVEVLVIGNIATPPLDVPELHCHRVDITGKSFWRIIHDVLEIGELIAPTHVHSFDDRAHFFGRWLARRHKAKCYITKPGGADPSLSRHRYYPYSPDIVCFSEENIKYFASRRKWQGSRFHFLPQRVAFPEPDERREKDLRAVVGEKPVLLRIARIGTHHVKSIKQTFHLAAALRKRGVSLACVIVGAVQEPESLKEIEALVGPDDHLITDAHFTTNAAALLPVATAVVGTGRGLMEAALLERVLLVPDSTADTPILLTQENWRELAWYNFSARGRLTDKPPSIDVVVRAFEVCDTQAASEISKIYAASHAPIKYDQVYRAPQSGRRAPIDFIVNGLLFLSGYVKSVVL